MFEYQKVALHELYPTALVTRLLTGIIMTLISHQGLWTRPYSLTNIMSLLTIVLYNGPTRDCALVIFHNILYYY